MDSSSRLPERVARILDPESLRVPADQLIDIEWAQIIWEVVSMCKPHIKYFPGMKKLWLGIINPGLIGDYKWRRTPKSIFNPQELFPEIERWRAVVLNDSLLGVERNIFQHFSLVLLDNGDLFSWFVVYEAGHLPGLGFRGHREGTEERARSCSFLRISSAEDIQKHFDMARKIREQINPSQKLLPSFFYHVISKIFSLLDEGCRVRQQRLISMIALKDEVGAIRARIS